ncbi:hypothetical protein V8C86DRAFT_2491313 [Haematococcus lacustris]
MMPSPSCPQIALSPSSRPSVASLAANPPPPSSQHTMHSSQPHPYRVHARQMHARINPEAPTQGPALWPHQPLGTQQPTLHCPGLAVRTSSLATSPLSQRHTPLTRSLWCHTQRRQMQGRMGRCCPCCSTASLYWATQAPTTLLLPSQRPAKAVVGRSRRAAGPHLAALTSPAPPALNTRWATRPAGQAACGAAQPALGPPPRQACHTSPPPSTPPTPIQATVVPGRASRQQHTARPRGRGRQGRQGQPLGTVGGRAPSPPPPHPPSPGTCPPARVGL